MVSRIIFTDVSVKELVISNTSNINQLEKNTRGACVISPDKIENDVSLCIIKVLLTIKFKSVHKNNHTLQQQMTLLLSVKKREQRSTNDERSITDKNKNQRGQALGSLVSCTKRKESQC